MLEILLALGLTALVLLALGLLIALAMQWWRRETLGAERYEALARGLAVVRADLAGIRPRRAEPGLLAPMRFQGSSGDVTFVTGARPEVQPPGEYVVRIEARNTATGGLELVRVTARLSAREWPPALGDPVTLLAGPFDFRFSYASDDGGWTDSWAEPVRLPSRIRLEVLDTTTDRLAVPPLEVRLKVTGESLCTVGTAVDCGR